MMTQTVQTIYNAINDWAPFDSMESWDKGGLELGDWDKPVSSALVALEIDSGLCRRLLETPVDLVWVHHPIFFKPLSQLRYTSDMGRIIHAFMQHSTALISSHTNLDIAPGGVNDTFITHYGLDPQNGTALKGGHGQCFYDINMSVQELQARQGARVVGAKQDRLNHLVVACGSGHGSVRAAAEAGIDGILTGELTYHDEQFCAFNGITALVVGHKESEELVIPVMADTLRAVDPTLQVDLVPLS